MDSMFPCYSLVKMKAIWLYYLVLINPYKVVGGYFYFSSNFNDITDHI